MRDNIFGSLTPYNIEGDYQKSLLKICDEIDEIREFYDTDGGPGALQDVKKKVKSLIFKMGRNRKFYDKSSDGKKGELSSKTFRELTKKLGKIEEGEDLETFIEELNLMTAKAGVFLKSFEDTDGGSHYGEDQ